MIVKKKLLIVDDSEINRAILKNILEQDYDIIEADDGAAALKILETGSNDMDAVLLDIMMPTMDGYTFLEIFKKNPLYSNIPVIVMTQSNEENDEIKALTLGATDFLTKPYKPTIIKKRLENILQLRETAALRNIVEHDALTGIYNRNTFYKKTENLLIKEDATEYDILCIDIERFKLVNDLFGMKEGDKLLCFLAAAVKAAAEIGNGIGARLGNDIFALCIVRDTIKQQDIQTGILERVRNYPLNFRINLRFGIYCIQDKTLSVSNMCDRAKLAIESIKGKYGQISAFYDDKERENLLKEQEILNDMHSALTEEQFELYLQPKYDLSTKEPKGAEALVRWNHPRKGIIPPADFIPLFEKNGFVMKLDYYMWERACRLLKKWKEEGYLVMPVSVNVSRINLYNPQLCQSLIDLVEKYGIEPKYLNLELTESAYTDNPEILIKTMETLQAYGFIIMMDDFGSGYSSLNLLKDLPVDILKIDLKFLYGADHHGRGASILTSVIQMANGLSLPAVAEGVETKEQSDFLQDIGCAFVQGYYYARPMPVEEYERTILAKP